jgi:hypothetical protein
MRNGLLALLLLGAAACTPATQYNRGINVDYRPASAAQGQERIVGSAVKYTDKDLDALKAAGGVYLGELEVRAEKSKDLQSASGAGALDGRVSLEAAQRGASHFTLTASDIEHSIKTARDSQIIMSGGRNTHEEVQTVKARYALWRVEPAHFAELSKELQPTALPGKATAAAPASAKPAGEVGTTGTTGATASPAK